MRNIVVSSYHLETNGDGRLGIDTPVSNKAPINFITFFFDVKKASKHCVVTSSLDILQIFTAG